MADYTVNSVTFDNVTSFETIAAAIAAASNGDRIIVDDGSYAGAVIDKEIILEAATPGGATITGPSVNQGSALRIEAGLNNVTVTGFNLVASTNDLAAVYAVGNNSTILIQNNTIDGGLASHAFLAGGAAGFGLNGSTLTGNTFLGNGGTGGSAPLVYVNGMASLGVTAAGNSITNNTVEGNPAGGLLMGIESSATTITGNTFDGNASYAQLEVFGTGNTISANDFGADGQPFQDGTGTYDAAAIIASNTISGGVVYIEGKSGFFASIQAAIDAAVDGDVISVTPGDYTGTANYNGADNTNSGSNPVGLLINKSVTIQGVGADGTPITDVSGILATFTSGVQSNWGTNIHVTAPDVTIRGLELLGVDSIGGPANQVVNKVIEVLQGGFVLDASIVGALAGETVGATGVGAIYIGDETVTTPVGFVSDIDTVTITGSTIGGSVTFSNGAGFGVPALDLDFTVTDNLFTAGTGIGIQGQITGFGWLLAPAQAPTTVTGNTFDGDTSRIIREVESDPAQIQIDKAYIENFIANNNVGDFAYQLDATGQLKQIPVNGGVYFSAAIDDRASDLGALQPGETLVTQDGTFMAAATGATWFVFAGQSIQAAMTAAAAGDTIIVGPGTYAETVLISNKAGLTLISADGRGTTIIDGSDASGHLGTIQVGAGVSDLRIEGFTIKGINGNGAIEKGAVYVQGATDGMQLVNNEMVARGDSAMTVEYSTLFTNATIDGNIFSGKTFLGANPESLPNNTFG